jgi:hypothetical protein
MVLKPTAWQTRLTSFIDSESSKASMTDGASQLSSRSSPNIERSMIVLPAPDGPTIRPTFQSCSSSGASSCHC